MESKHEDISTFKFDGEIQDEILDKHSIDTPIIDLRQQEQEIEQEIEQQEIDDKATKHNRIRIQPTGKKNKQELEEDDTNINIHIIRSLNGIVALLAEKNNLIKNKTSFMNRLNNDEKLIKHLSSKTQFSQILPDKLILPMFYVGNILQEMASENIEYKNQNQKQKTKSNQNQEEVSDGLDPY